jgi:hypothetical protein
VRKWLARIGRVSMFEMDVKRYGDYSTLYNGGLWLLGR